MTAFDDAVSLQRQPDGSWLGRTSPDYANMVGPFGGITAATLLNAVLSDPSRAGEPLALTVSFAAPVADGAFQARANLVRNNRTTQHWSLELVQPEGIVATGSAVLALRRRTWSAPEAVMPDAPPPETLPRTPLHGAPPWVQRYDMRFVTGALPGFDEKEQPSSASCLWIRDDPARRLDFLSLAAICDNFFPRIFLRRRKLVAAGTVTLTTYFHADGAMLAEQADRFVLGTARALAFRDGFFDQRSEIWSDAGRLLASSDQIVYFRD
jgi:hypothetical protein